MIRALGRLVLTLVVLAALAAALDLGLTVLAEREAAERVSEQLGAPTVVELQGWPVTLHALAGRIPRADVVVRDLPLGDAQVRRLDATLLDVSTDLPAWRASASGIPPARAGTFTARLTADAVARLVGLPATLPLGELVLEEGLVRLELGGLASVTGRVSVEDGQVVVHPETPLLDLVRVPIEVPPLPAGARITGVEIVPGELVLRGTMTGG